MAYTTTTLLTLRTRLQDRYTSDPFWSATEATDAINEALRYFNLFTGYWRGSASVVTAAGDRFLTVSATLTYRTRVYVNGQVLARKSIVELYRSRRDWRTQTTASGSPVPTTPREWAPIGLRGLAIWPADAAGGTTITCDAVKLTPILTADGQFVDIGEEELKLVLDEALWVLGFKQPSRMEGLQARHQAFLHGCLERNDQLRASAWFRQALGLDQEQRLEPGRQPTTESVA